MLRADQINVVLDALHGALREKIPHLKSPVLGGMELVKTDGTYGSVAFGTLLAGDVDGKITVILEWETALKLATKVTKGKLDHFGDEAKGALEEALQRANEIMTTRFSEMGLKVDALQLPTLIDTNVLTALHKDRGVLKVQINTLWEPILLFFSFLPDRHLPKPRSSGAK